MPPPLVIGAIAAVHKQLHKSEYVGTVPLDQYLTDLCRELATTSNSLDRPLSLIVDAPPLAISNDIAVPLGLIVNELLTNAILHSQSVGEGGAIHVVVASNTDDFLVSVSDPGGGPELGQTIGLGTRLIDGFVSQINATIERRCLNARYTVTVKVPRAGLSQGTH